VRSYLFDVVRFWIQTFDIDGLRLDAADKLPPVFREELSSVCKSLKSGFWLMGEVVAGNYNEWAHEGGLDSVTNYVLYKGLWSSFNDKNLWELAYTLNRQYGPDGTYNNIYLYNFADNHDVDRVASMLTDKANLFPLYGLLFTAPGIPSIYYGSEYGAAGMRGKTSDYDLRPSWKELENARVLSNGSSLFAPVVDPEALYAAIKQFIDIRKAKNVLQKGSYRQIHVAMEQLAFVREHPQEEPVLVVVNAGKTETHLTINTRLLNGNDGECWHDLLSGEDLYSGNGELRLKLYPHWLRVLERRRSLR
jgi:glycosidase